LLTFFSSFLNQSHIKVSFISDNFPGTLNNFLKKFTGENQYNITNEVRNIIKNANAVAIDHNIFSKKG
jgi:hypothetical protein